MFAHSSDSDARAAARNAREGLGVARAQSYWLIRVAGAGAHDDGVAAVHGPVAIRVVTEIAGGEIFRRFAFAEAAGHESRWWRRASEFSTKKDSSLRALVGCGGDYFGAGSASGRRRVAGDP